MEQEQMEQTKSVTLHSGAMIGMKAYPVTITVTLHRDPHMGGFHIHRFRNSFYGEWPYARETVRVSESTVRSAIQESGFLFPHDWVDVRVEWTLDKEGEGNTDVGGTFRDLSMLDLPIAMGILAVSGVIPEGHVDGVFAFGMLDALGYVKRVRGELPLAMLAAKTGARLTVGPGAGADLNETPWAYGDGLAVAVSSLRDCVQDVMIEGDWCGVGEGRDSNVGDREESPYDDRIDFSQIQGQKAVRRALEVAAAGGHNVLLIGPPGVGKTMFARRLSTILPPMTGEEQTRVAIIASAAGHDYRQGKMKRPFRAPHYTVSAAALEGSTSSLGEYTLATWGVLMLDEFPEFRKSALDALKKTVQREKVQGQAGAILVAAMNECPCGYRGYGGTEESRGRKCECTDEKILAYRQRVESYLDLFDIRVRLNYERHERHDQEKGESSAVIQQRVNRARQIQQKHGSLNAHESTQPEYRVARTIADMDIGGYGSIRPHHLEEARGFRVPLE